MTNIVFELVQVLVGEDHADANFLSSESMLAITSVVKFWNSSTRIGRWTIPDLSCSSAMQNVQGLLHRNIASCHRHFNLE